MWRLSIAVAASAYTLQKSSSIDLVGRQANALASLLEMREDKENEEEDGEAQETQSSALKESLRRQKAPKDSHWKKVQKNAEKWSDKVMHGKKKEFYLETRTNKYGKIQLELQEARRQRKDARERRRFREMKRLDQEEMDRNVRHSLRTQAKIARALQQDQARHDKLLADKERFAQRLREVAWKRETALQEARDEKKAREAKAAARA